MRRDGTTEGDQATGTGRHWRGIGGRLAAADAVGQVARVALCDSRVGRTLCAQEGLIDVLLRGRATRR
jgi:hypothetical protein